MLITVKDAEAKYGLPRRTLYYLIELGELPRVRITPERVFLKEQDIESLIENNYGRENDDETI
jgi:predicted DNA-binding transcriptional regulator AlpA